MANRYYSSSEMLAIVGCTRKTLRVLEQNGLMRPARTRGELRYSRECVRRLWLLLTLRDLGMSIAKVAEIMRLRDEAPNGGEAAATLASSLDKVIERIDSKVRDLHIARESLVVARRTLDGCGACERAVSGCGDCARSGRLDVVAEVLLAGAGNTTEP